MMWMARTGPQERQLPDEDGELNSVFRRYRRWGEDGVFDAVPDAPAEMVERGHTADMIARTVVRAQHCAVGVKKGLGRPECLAARAGLTTKLHARCDGKAANACVCSLGFMLTPGAAHEVQGFAPCSA